MIIVSRNRGNIEHLHLISSANNFPTILVLVCNQREREREREIIKVVRLKCLKLEIIL